MSGSRTRATKRENARTDLAEISHRRELRNNEGANHALESSRK